MGTFFYRSCWRFFDIATIVRLVAIQVSSILKCSLIKLKCRDSKSTLFTFIKLLLSTMTMGSKILRAPGGVTHLELSEYTFNRKRCSLEIHISLFLRHPLVNLRHQHMGSIVFESSFLLQSAIQYLPSGFLEVHCYSGWIYLFPFGLIEYMSDISNYLFAALAGGHRSWCLIQKICC